MLGIASVSIYYICYLNYLKFASPEFLGYKFSHGK